MGAKENERWRGFTYFVLAVIEHEPTIPWLTETNLSPVTVDTNLYFWSEARWELTEVYSIHGHVITNRMDDVHNFNTMINHIVFKTRRWSNFDRAFIAGHHRSEPLYFQERKHSKMDCACMFDFYSGRGF